MRMTVLTPLPDKRRLSATWNVDHLQECDVFPDIVQNIGGHIGLLYKTTVSIGAIEQHRVGPRLKTISPSNQPEHEALGIFRSTATEVLVCYSTFGRYMSIDGRASTRETVTIEWGYEARSVAFLPPYFLLLTPSVSEARLIGTGFTVGIETGRDMFLTWE